MNAAKRRTFVVLVPVASTHVARTDVFAKVVTREILAKV